MPKGIAIFAKKSESSKPPVLKKAGGRLSPPNRRHTAAVRPARMYGPGG